MRTEEMPLVRQRRRLVSLYRSQGQALSEPRLGSAHTFTASTMSDPRISETRERNKAQGRGLIAISAQARVSREGRRRAANRVGADAGAAPAGVKVEAGPFQRPLPNPSPAPPRACIYI